MVCVPCILLPILLAIYIKFIQPIVFRFLPESWKTTFDAILYPTCPIRAAPPRPSAEEKDSVAEGDQDDQGARLVECDTCNADGDKKDN